MQILIGEKILELRTQKNMTQEELAERLGVTRQSVSKWESNGTFPNINKLLEICDIFQVSLDYLLRGKKYSPGVENNISGHLSNSPFIQANNGGVVFNGESGKTLSPESVELLHIYESLGGRDRLKLLNFAVELERSA